MKIKWRTTGIPEKETNNFNEVSYIVTTRWGEVLQMSWTKKGWNTNINLDGKYDDKYDFSEGDIIAWADIEPYKGE